MENPNPRLPGVAKLLLIFGLLLVANSAYVAAFGDPTLFYVANALIHPALGIIATILLVAFAIRHREFFARPAGTLTVLVLAVMVAFGGYIMVVGMTRPHSMALYIHVAAAIISVALLLVILHSRARESCAR